MGLFDSLAGELLEGAVAGVVRGIAGSGKDAKKARKALLYGKGTVKEDKEAEPARFEPLQITASQAIAPPQKTAQKCASCSAPLAGHKGDIVRCLYCDSDQLL